MVVISSSIVLAPDWGCVVKGGGSIVIHENFMSLGDDMMGKARRCFGFVCSKELDKTSQN
jgi:hypothetical protein